MKTFLSLLVLAMLTVHFSQAQTFQWAKQTGAPGQSGVIEPTSSALDANDNHISTGNFSGIIDFDPGVGVSNLSTIAMITDVYIQKLNSAGNFQWAFSLAGNGMSYANHVVTDAAGNIYICGSFDSPVDFDPGVATNIVSPLGNQDAYILKLNASGVFQWVKTFGSTNLGATSLLSAAIDNNGDLVLAGYFADVVDFDPGPGVTNLVASSFADQFTLKLTNSGNFVWAKAFNGNLPDYITPKTVVIDGNNDILLSGTFNGTFDFDASASTSSLSSTNQSDDIYVTKLNSTGNLVWAKVLGNSNYESVSGVAKDAQNNLYLCGNFFDTLDANPGAAINNIITTNNGGILVLKLNSNGDYVWAKKMDGIGYTYSEHMTMNPQQHLYITGYFDQTTDFDPGMSTQNLTSNGDYDVFVSKLDSSGNFLTAKRVGGINADGAFKVQANATGSIYTLGLFASTVDFDPGVGVSNMTANSSDYDQFCTKWNVCNPSITNLSAYHCNSYTLNGQTYTASGMYSQLFQNANGCDSIVNLNLTIGSTNTTINHTECSGGSFVFNGQTYTTPGTYTQFYTNAAGCDSNYIINLSFGTPSTYSFSDVACDVYFFGNQILFSTGTYTQVFTNASGCDSTVTLNLTVNTSTYNYSFISNCGPYVFNGITHSTDGYYSYFFVSANGCDSVVEFDLEIKQNTSSTQNVSACGSYTFNGQTYTTSGTYTDTLVNTVGCDSVVTLNLTLTNVNLNVTQSGATLTSAATSPSTYQWINCATNTPINGATSQSYTATANGSYAVIVTLGSCSDTSACRPVTGIGINEANSTNSLSVYPNPAKDKITVDLPLTTSIKKVEVRTLAGQVMYSTQLASSSRLEIAIQDWAKGMYFLVMESDSQRYVSKFVKE